VKPAYVTGLGFWGSGLADIDAFLSGTPGLDGRSPPCSLLTPRLARRTSLLTRMMLEVTRQACEASRVEMAAVPTVFATARGELETLHALLEMLDSDGELSPARFHNSVYNTASGYFSIATGNRSFTTTLAGGAETVALGLLEACCVLEERQGSVVVAFGDETVTLPFLPKQGSEGFAAALCLTSERPPGGGLGSISAPHRGGVADLPAVPLAYDSNPVAPVLAVLRALRQRTTGVVALSRGTLDGWVVDLGPDLTRS